MIRKVLLGAGALALLAGTTAPAAAQVGDFFCSTFSVFCPDPPPPPPPPPPAPLADASPEPTKHRARKHKAVKKVKREAAEPAAAPAPQ